MGRMNGLRLHIIGKTLVLAPQPDEVAAAYIPDWAQMKNPVLYVIRERHSGAPWGEIYTKDASLVFADGPAVEVVGSKIGGAQRRPGFARQATCLLVNHLFRSSRLVRIIAFVGEANRASRMTCAAAGMHAAAPQRADLVVVYAAHGAVRYSITRAEWGSTSDYRTARLPF